MAVATMESSSSQVATRWWRFTEDTWPLDGLCIYKFQLAIQVDRRQVHPSRPEPNRKPGLRLAKHQKSLTDFNANYLSCAPPVTLFQVSRLLR
jgi:hypothetical protein